MKRFILSKSMLCLFLLGMVCNVAWAQETETYTVERQETKPTNGYYVIYSESSSGKGWVHYNSSMNERKFRVATDKDFTNGVPADETKYIWKLQNGSDGTFTLQCLNEGVYIPADAGANQNMKGTTTANLELTTTGKDGEWYISQTNYKHSVNGQPAATTYIHTNAPGGYPNLSYWPNTNPNGTSIRAQFFKITSLEPADLEVIYKFNDEVLEEYNVNTFLVKGSPYTIQNPLSNKYLTIAECDVNGTPLEAVDGEFVTTINNATTITVTLKEELPFRVSTDFNSATWYYMQINSGGWEFVRNDGEAPYTNTTNRSDLNEGCQWAFVGDALNGFKILNKTAGANQTLSFDDTAANETVAKMKEENKLWTIEKGNGGFVIRQGADECLNDFDDDLKIWKNASSPQGAGSAFRVLSTSVTELTNWNNLSYYVLNAERSPLIYSATAEDPSKLSSGMVDGISHNVDDINQQFIIARTSSTPEGYYYLYSMGAKKFVGADLSFTDFPEPILSFEPSGDKLYPWFVKINNKYVIPSDYGTAGNKVYHVATADNDEGKRYQIVDVQKTFDWENDMSIFTSIERAEGMLTDASQLSNEKVYTVATYARGYWYYLEGKDAMWSTVKADAEADSSDPAQQFAFLTVAGKTYLYSVGAKKFVVKSGGNTAYSDDPTQAVEFLKGQGNKFYPLVVAFVDGAERHQISISNGHEIPVLTNWNELSGDGNTVDVREVGSYDLTNVETKIEEYLIATTLKSGLTDLITEANELKPLFDQDVQDQLTAAVTAAQNVLNQQSPTADELNEQITLLTKAINSVKYVSEITGFQNGYVYTFVTARGQMGATESGDNVISTARTSVADTDTDYFKWTVYKSTNGNYYLYNLGKQMFMGVQSANNTEIAFVETPAGKKLTFKQSSSDDYPIMFSTDNAAVVNHSTDHGGGLISWTGGWNTLNDGGSNHKVTLVARLSENELAKIAAKVENYDRSLPIKVEVEGWTAENPNTHFGTVTATTGGNVSSTKLLLAHMAGGHMAYSNIDDEVAFTRAYRGFEFQGFYVGEESLGKSFELTEALKNSITDANPLIAKFTATSDVTLFYDDDPFSYRIPAIATTSTGRLIAVSDYRYSLDDIGRYNFGTANPGIDLVMRYSDDNGKTWSETKTIAKCSSIRGANDCAYGDAAIAVVGEKVLVMGAAGDVMFGNGSATAHNRTVRIFSDDNGETWTEPQDISETLFIGEDATIQNGYTAFFGSGKLAVDENYNNTDVVRIYGAMLIKKEGCNNAIYVIYTDDFGVTWSILGGSQTHVTANDEPKVEILPSGQILLSVRRGGGRQFNVFTYSDKATNAGSWNGNVNGCPNGGSNTCNGEPFVVDAKDANGNAVKLLLQSQPKGGSGLYDRRDVTIWYKEVTDATYTSAQIAADWTQGLQVSTQQSAYSAMALQNDGKIAFFFEEAPCYGDDQAKGYCMVYVPLTIETITKGNYFSKDTDLEAATTIDVTLTDAEGNTYKDQLTECKVGEVATKLREKYPFITLGDNVSLTYDGTAYTYSNTLMLPFRVSNSETTVWHNIYFLSNKIYQVNYPVYLSASNEGDEFVATCKDNVAGGYGDNSFNTLEHADKISWAVYQSGNGFAFKFKNKLTGKFIQATSVATGNSNNVKYVNDADATVFELIPTSNNFYAVKANVGGTDGYLCCTSVSNGFATHFERYNHAGGTVTFAEVDNFEKLIAEVNTVLSQIGTSLGKYSVTDANAETAETAKVAMENSSSVKLNDLIAYRDLLSGATLNMPKAGQYFRVAYDYGGSVGKLYMQGVASDVKGVQFTNETDNASIWVYLDSSLYSYTAGKNLREHVDDRGLHDTKTTAEFSASTRAKGKYNIKLGSWLHANSNNGNYYSDHCGSNDCAQHDLILEEVAMNTSTIGSYEIGTYYANHATIIPDGVTAYIANQSPIMENGTGVITMTKITDGIIPAQTGVVIRGAEGTYTFESSDEQGTTNTEGNLMVGYAGVQKSLVTLDNAYATYVLTVQNEKAGFYKKNANFNVYNNKAYLKVPNTQGAVMSIRLHFDNEGITDIIEVPTEVLNMNGEIYDLSGRRVEKAGKGVYIINGKKVIF